MQNSIYLTNSSVDIVAMGGLDKPTNSLHRETSRQLESNLHEWFDRNEKSISKSQINFNHNNNRIHFRQLKIMLLF